MKWRRFDITAFMSAFLFGKIKLNYRRQPSVLGIVVISGLNFLKFWDANGTFKVDICELSGYKSEWLLLNFIALQRHFHEYRNLAIIWYNLKIREIVLQH